MYLSKLKIFGFKSFAQRVEINFPGNGLTAVVGPNGCGKSNIVDAIRWVMGEQRASQLRSSKMQDVIFSGTEDRPAQNMAEVSLVIDNSSGLLPYEFSEIQITRRAFRNGDSEYLLNNQECRLRDIQNLFYDTGMGATAYSLMEQRMIDSILSDKAEERRVLFEEAAGVSKYKQQRRETLRQLDRVSLDMERIEDNLRHARQSVRQHERQVQRAEEWHRVRNRLKSLDLSITMDNYLENAEHIKLFAQNHEKLEDERSKLQSRITELETQVAERRLDIAADEETYRKLEALVSQNHRDIAALNADYSVQQGRIENIEANMSKLQHELSHSAEQLELLEEKKIEIEAQISQAPSAEDGDLLREMELIEERVLVLRDKVEELRERKREATLKQREQLDIVINLRSKWQHSEGELSQVLAQIENLAVELSTFAEKKQELLDEKQRIDEEHAKTQKFLEENQIKIDEFNEEHGVQQEEWQKLLYQERVLSEEFISLQSRVQVLEQMEASGSGVEEGTRWAMDEQSERVLGILGEKITVHKHPVLVEFCLGNALQVLLLKDGASGEQILNDLEQAQSGRLSLLLPQFSQKTASVQKLEDPRIQANILDFVDCDGDFKTFLHKIAGSWYLVEDFATALALAEEYAQEDFYFVSPQGRVVHSSGLVMGGATLKGGMLSRRQELSGAQELLEKLAKQQNELELKKDEKHEELAVLAQKLEDAQNLFREKTMALHEFSSATKVLESRLQTVAQQKQNVLNQQANLKEKRKNLVELRANDSDLSGAEELLQERETALERISEILEEEEMQLRNNEDDFRELQAKSFESRSFLQGLTGQISNLDEQKKLLASMSDNQNKELEQQVIELKKWQESLIALQSLIELRNEELSVNEVKRDAAQEKYSVLSSGMEAWHDEIRQLNTVLRSKDGENHEIIRRVETLKMNQDRHKERIYEAWEFDLATDTEFERVDYDVESVSQEMRELRAQLKKIGPVSASIMEDYEKEKARLAEVEKQFDDLDRARSSLARTIDKLDRIARERFLDTFRQIQKNFQDVFSSLMVGGEGRLSLEEGVDPLEAEIEVNARPTGKKMRGVRLLSGGERALTATSLLFALYMVKPSPYCILDEVDGPLDDANIGRFVQLLRRFSRQTQFIIVTHNKRTMAACDMLYGVTQEYKGVSRIASVELNEAQGLVG